MLKWEGTYGYGDIVGAVTNAMWRYQRTGDNELTFMWYTERPWHPPEQHYDANDPESIIERVNYIISSFKGTQELSIKHEVIEGKAHRFENRWKSNQWWATMWDTEIQPVDDGSIVVWHPFNNVDDLRKEGSGTAYKSPMSRYTWSKVTHALEMSGRRIEYVNYRMPIHEVFDKISKAHLCVGYEGIGQLISKSFWKPLITYSNQKKLSHVTGGPWSLIDNKYNENVLHDIPSVVDKQLGNIDHCRKIYETRQSRNRD